MASFAPTLTGSRPHHLRMEDLHPGDVLYLPETEEIEAIDAAAGTFGGLNSSIRYALGGSPARAVSGGFRDHPVIVGNVDAATGDVDFWLMTTLGGKNITAKWHSLFSFRQANYNPIGGAAEHPLRAAGEGDERYGPVYLENGGTFRQKGYVWNLETYRVHHRNLKRSYCGQPPLPQPMKLSEKSLANILSLAQELSG